MRDPPTLAGFLLLAGCLVLGAWSTWWGGIAYAAVGLVYALLCVPWGSRVYFAMRWWPPTRAPALAAVVGAAVRLGVAIVFWPLELWTLTLRGELEQRAAEREREESAERLAAGISRHDDP